MPISAERMAILREHVRAESEHDIDALLGGMTSECFNDVVGVPEPFVGPTQTAERYRKHWTGFLTLRCEFAASCAPTNRVSSPRTSGAALISARSWGGRRRESQW